MFTKKDKRTPLKREIDSRVEEMILMDLGSDEYKNACECIRKLMEANSFDDNGLPANVEFFAKCGFTLLEILIILNYEKTGIITTKVMQFIGRFGI